MDNETYFKKFESTSADLFDLALGHQNNEDRYTGMEEIGRGATKVIHRALDLSSGRPIALATPDENLSKDQLQSFLEEARLSATLQHPNIIQVYDLGYKQDGTPYFTMKLCEGQKLDEKLQQTKSNLFELIEIFLKICEAMAYAHNMGAVHRDLKEENVLIGNFGEVLICDWGSAQILPDSILEAEVGQVSRPISRGTPGFMSPEQMAGEAPHMNQDIYSLGALLYKMLCKKTPSTKSFQKPSSFETNIPEGLEAICLKAMAENASERYQRCADLIKDVKAWQLGFAPQAEEASLQKQIKLFFLRHKTLSLSCLISLIIISSLSVYTIISLKEKEQQTANQRDRAEQALKLYDLEKASRENIATLGADYFIRQANQLISSHTYQMATDLLQSIPTEQINESQSKAMNATYGRLYFYQQKFNKAIRFFKLAKEAKNKNLFALAKKFSLRKESDSIMLNTQDTLDLLDKLYEIDIHQVYCFFRWQVLNISNHDEQIHLIKKMISFNNPAIEKLNVKFTREGDKYHIDLSNNPKLRRWEPLRQMPFKSINLSNCPIREHFFILNKMPLEELNISGCKVKNYEFLKDLKVLKRLIVSAKETNNKSLQENLGQVELIIEN